MDSEEFYELLAEQQEYEVILAPSRIDAEVEEEKEI